MASIFSRIVAGEIPSYKIAEDDRYYAFLDISPLQKGHTLVIPKREVDYIFDLEDDELAGLQVFAKKVARTMRARTGSASCPHPPRTHAERGRHAFHKSASDTLPRGIRADCRKHPQGNLNTNN